jgi:PTH2 family peptidyl-tRNA hydrolase
MKVKQVIVARKGLMSPGKLAAQVAHASLLAYDRADKEHIDEWKRSGITKVVLAVKSEKDLVSIYKQASGDYLPTSLVCDEGRTEVTPGTITCVGIGPAPEEAINQITGALELY